MLAHTILEVGRYSGVVFTPFLDDIETPHSIFGVGLPSQHSCSGQAHIGSRLSRKSKKYRPERRIFLNSPVHTLNAYALIGIGRLTL